jgi:hypothetical protein
MKNFPIQPGPFPPFPPSGLFSYLAFFLQCRPSPRPPFPFLSPVIVRQGTTLAPLAAIARYAIIVPPLALVVAIPPVSPRVLT